MLCMFDVRSTTVQKYDYDNNGSIIHIIKQYIKKFQDSERFSMTLLSLAGASGSETTVLLGLCSIELTLKPGKL